MKRTREDVLVVIGPIGSLVAGGIVGYLLKLLIKVLTTSL